ncbi:nucleoside deaminase [Cellulomonas marina]|nr:nucleoside deaminase [Cellulomonas marina]
MALALDEARAALETGDVPVGAVVVAADGTVLGRGRNRREADADPTAHAEVLALRAAAAAAGEWRLAGCSLVVTLEPCLMCAGAAVLARVDRVVLGAWDPKAGACGSQWDVVRDRRLNHRPEVVGGVLEAASAELLRAFFDAHRGAGPEEPDRPVDEVPVDEVPVDEVLVDEVLVDRRPGGAG